MNKIAVVAVCLLLMAGMAYAKDFEVKKKAGPYDVEVKIDKNPPVVGDNTVSIAIKEAGRDVTDAKVVVDYAMPAMPGMPAMNYKGDATLDGHSYRMVMKLSMAGPWNIAVKIKKGRKTDTVKFNVDAH